MEGIECWVSSHRLRRAGSVHHFSVLDSVMSCGGLKSAIAGEVTPEKKNNVYLGADHPTE